MGLRDDVGSYNFADSITGGRTGINRATNSGNIATHDRGHETGVDLLPTDETHIRAFHHRISGFDHRHQATTFDHS
jgi:hypothetical protein